MVDMFSCSLGISSACERAYPTPEQHFTALGINVAIVGGYRIIAATPEMLALAKAGMEGCKSAPTICLNNIGLQLGEAVIPGGSGAGGALVVGRTAQEIAAVKNTAQSLPSVDKLSQAASSVNRNGLSDAGRSLQKHSGRPGSVYSATDKKATTLNNEAQYIVDDILTNPKTTIEIRTAMENKQKITVIEAHAPDGRILRFNEDGTRFIGFREP